MERLQQVSLTRADLQTILVDPASPYFGHLRLREQVRGRGLVERDVLIGRATFVDSARINIVDWRHAPVSQLFYRYGEGSDYEERFDDRDVEGEILVRRTLTIEGGVLVRIASPQGIWVRRPRRRYPRGRCGALGPSRATRPTSWPAASRPAPARPGNGARGVSWAPRPRGVQALNRHLPEIAALIDPRQFDVVTARDAGVVVIQGGAGSGKTTVGLHRLAYLAFTFPNKFPPARMVVVTYGAALAAYIGEVLPSLGIEGVRGPDLRQLGGEGAPRGHPLAARGGRRRGALLPSRGSRVIQRCCTSWSAGRAAHAGKRNSRAVVELWADLLTDRTRLLALLRDAPEMPVSESDIVEAHRIMVDRVVAVAARDPRDRAREPRTVSKAIVAQSAANPRRMTSRSRWASGSPASAPSTAICPRGCVAWRARWVTTRTTRTSAATPESTACAPRTIGRCWISTTSPSCCARTSCCAGSSSRSPHLFVDEAQDLSPMKLVGADRTDQQVGAPRARPPSPRPFDHAGRRHLAEAVPGQRLRRLARRARPPGAGARGRRAAAHRLSIHARDPGAGPRRPWDRSPTRSRPRRRAAGRRSKAFRFSTAGAAVAFLAEALRDLPRASRAPRWRCWPATPSRPTGTTTGCAAPRSPRCAACARRTSRFARASRSPTCARSRGSSSTTSSCWTRTTSTYGRDDESRHLFHIGVTRAAHQLWLIVTATPTPAERPRRRRNREAGERRTRRRSGGRRQARRRRRARCGRRRAQRRRAEARAAGAPETGWRGGLQARGGAPTTSSPVDAAPAATASSPSSRVPRRRPRPSSSCPRRSGSPAASALRRRLLHVRWRDDPPARRLRRVRRPQRQRRQHRVGALSREIARACASNVTGIGSASAWSTARWASSIPTSCC